MRKAAQGITMTCCECGRSKHLKTWRQDLEDKKRDNTYLCHSCNQRGDRARGFAKPGHWTDERRKQTSERVSGENNPMFGVDWRTLVDSETVRRHRENTSKATSGENNPMSGVDWRTLSDSETIRNHGEKIKAWANSPEGQKQCSEAGLASSAKPYRMTNPERLVRAWLTENGLEHTYGARLENRSYDFKVGSWLIEVHGDYWHANPLYYGPGKRPLNERQLFKVERDAEKKEIASRLGYDLLVIWETEINNNDFSKLKVLKGM